MGEQWAETTLGNVADFVNGYPFKPADLAGLTYPVIRIKQLLDASAEIDYTDLNTPERNHIKNGDLIFSWSGTLASRIWSRGPAALNQHLFKVNERPGIDRGWLHLALDHAVEELSEKTHGTTMKHITKGVLETHSIRLPPLPVQRRIADLVAHLDNHIADLQSERDAASRVLVRMRATQMEPNGDWKAGRLDQVAEVRLGRMLSKERSSGDDLAPYIRNANVQWNALNLADLKQMSFPTKEREIYALRAGDILVCEGGDPGRAVLLEKDLPGIYYQKAIHRVRCSEFVDPGFLYQWLACCYQDQRIEDLCTNTTIKHLTAEKFRTLGVRYPPIDDQIAIARTLEAASHVNASLNAELAALLNLRGSLLQGLLSGELVVPSDYDALIRQVA